MPLSIVILLLLSISLVIGAIFSPKFKDFLIELLEAIRNTWFIWIFFIFGSFLLIRVEQIQDVFSQLNSDRHIGKELIILFFTFVWSLTAWYCGRMILFLVEIHDIDNNSKQIIEWLPRIYSIIPPLLIAFGYGVADEGIYDGIGYSLALAALLTIYFVVKFIIFRKYNPKKNYEASANTLKVLFQEEKFLIRVCGWILLGGLLLITTFFTEYANIVAKFIQPIGIICFAFSFWTFVILSIIYLDSKFRLPYISFILFIFFLSSLASNNHYIRTINERKIKNDNRPLLKQHFSEWLKHRQKEMPKAGRYPVFIVAAEGGGARSAYWTASVLAELERSNLDFYRHVYAISGISGGSLGGVIYNSLYSRDMEAGKDNQPLAIKRQEEINDFFSNDFLSSLTAAFLFPNFIQAFIPFQSGSNLDRSRWLEDSWSEAYKDICPTRNHMDNAFLDLWDNSKYDIPSLFLNSTIVETGEKAIMSNIKIDTSTFHAIDVQASIGFQIPMKTATLLGARFPFITPPATIYSHPKEKDAFNLVDGGYIDNSGLETSLTIANFILNEIINSPDSIYSNVDVHVVLIKNSPKPVQRAFSASKINALKWGWDLRSPMFAFYNSWSNGLDGAWVNTDNYFEILKKYSARHQGNLISFELDRKVGRIPLGWYLSDAATNLMKNEARRICTEKECTNYQSYSAIKNILTKN